MKERYRVHQFNMSMTRGNLERFLNSLEGEIVAIVPNVSPAPATMVKPLLIVEKVDSAERS